MIRQVFTTPRGQLTTHQLARVLLEFPDVWFVLQDVETTHLQLELEAGANEPFMILSGVSP